MAQVAYTDENFASDTCEGELLAENYCDQAAYAVASNRAFGFGERWQSSVFHGPLGCVEEPHAEQASIRYFRLGEELEGEISVTVELGFAGTSRLQLNSAITADGAAIALPNSVLGSIGGFYRDSVAGEPCTPFWTPEGKVRCMPSSVHAAIDTTLFGDSKCAVPSYQCATAACDDTYLIGYRSHEPERELHTARELRVAVPVKGPSYYYEEHDGSCHAQEPSRQMFTAGELVPWERYPELGERNRPPSIDR